MEWDAETILSTYSTTDNHPSLIRVPRKPKSTSSSAGGNQGPSLVQLDKRVRDLGGNGGDVGVEAGEHLRELHHGRFRRRL